MDYEVIRLARCRSLLAKAVQNMMVDIVEARNVSCQIPPHSEPDQDDDDDCPVYLVPDSDDELEPTQIIVSDDSESEAEIISIQLPV